MPASNRIARHWLRTTNVDAARGFYAQLLGHDALPIVPLHEQAIARGARPHWLGKIEVDDVEASANAFVALGAERLGPIGKFPDGRDFTTLRDPGGAVVGLTSQGPADAAPLPVVWHQLATQDLARVTRAYTQLFGWRMTDEVTHPEHGVFHDFTWGSAADGVGNVGAISDIAGRPGRHPHWLFHVRVVDLERALSTVRAAQGLVLGPFDLPNGERVAVCDDPQGAAFALRG